jgi:hypothetical protein
MIEYLLFICIIIADLLNIEQLVGFSWNNLRSEMKPSNLPCRLAWAAGLFCHLLPSIFWVVS